MLPCVVFLKLSLWATLHEDAIVHGNCLSTKGKFFLSVEMYVQTFDFSCVKRIFEGLIKPITEDVF